MTPLDFIHFNGDSDPNTPINRVYEAMKKPLCILSQDKEWEVLGYYLGEDGKMILEIQEK